MHIDPIRLVTRNLNYSFQNNVLFSISRRLNVYRLQHYYARTADFFGEWQKMKCHSERKRKCQERDNRKMKQRTHPQQLVCTLCVLNI